MAAVAAVAALKGGTNRSFKSNPGAVLNQLAKDNQ